MIRSTAEWLVRAMDLKPIEASLILSFLRPGASLEPRIVVQARELTGVGFYTQFSVDTELRELGHGELPTGPMRGPAIASPESPSGTDSLLWPGESGIHTLEVFTYADAFPENLREFTLEQQ
ncbi:MAG: hypothetical protein AMXMBFR36_39060 [Acidobacteriota bacterium]